MDLSLKHWEQLTAAKRTALAKQMVKALPAGFSFDSVQTFAMGEAKHAVALFRFENAGFAFIPGGKVTLGFDATKWEPSAEEIASWQRTRENYGLRRTIAQHAAKVTRPLRKATVPPILMETVAGELGWERIGLDDKDVIRLRREFRGGNVTEHRGDVITRIRTVDGETIAERALQRTQAELAEHLKASGFRLPTSDEWEFACGGGATTLFRWGDHAKCDRYPTDVSPQEAAWRKKWVLSGGKLAYPKGGFASDWDFHRRPSAWGVSIASDPYKCELVAEPGTTRGGDGGNTICGGAGFFIGWLTLATSYFEKEACRFDKREFVDPEYCIGRRALELK